MQLDALSLRICNVVSLFLEEYNGEVIFAEWMYRM